MATLAAAGVATLGGAAQASAPAGVWSFPDSVVVYDEAAAQPTVVITGLFTVHTGEGPIGGEWGMSGYEPPVSGLLYYICKPDEKALCLMQWGEIKADADGGTCLGWGNHGLANGDVRSADADLADPDVFPIDGGVVPGVTPCNYLADVAEAEVPPEQALEESPEPTAEETPDEAHVDVPQPPVEEDPEVGPEPAVEPVPDASVGEDTSEQDTSMAPDSGAETTTGAETDDDDDDDTSAEGDGCVGAGAGGLIGALGAALALLGARRSRRD